MRDQAGLGKITIPVTVNRSHEHGCSVAMYLDMSHVSEGCEYR